MFPIISTLNRYTVMAFFLELLCQQEYSLLLLVSLIIIILYNYSLGDVSGVLITEISDHKMIFTVYPNNSLKDDTLHSLKKFAFCQKTSYFMNK